MLTFFGATFFEYHTLFGATFRRKDTLFGATFAKKIWEIFSAVVLYIAELLPLQKTMILVTHFMNIQNILQLIDY